jgi:hypothetical protein
VACEAITQPPAPFHPIARGRAGPGLLAHILFAKFGLHLPLKGVIESLATIGYKELKKTGAFFVPGFAKFVVIKKPATKERSGINPFTKEPTIFKAKPARKIIRARPVKAAKDAVS